MPLALEARPAIAEFLGRPGGVRAVARCSLFERLQFDALVVRRLDEHRVPPFPREDSRSHVARRRTSGKFLAAAAPSPGSSSVSQPPSRVAATRPIPTAPMRSEEHTSELQSLMRHSYAVFCLKKKKH